MSERDADRDLDIEGSYKRALLDDGPWRLAEASITALKRYAVRARDERDQARAELERLREQKKLHEGIVAVTAFEAGMREKTLPNPDDEPMSDSLLAYYAHLWGGEPHYTVLENALGQCAREALRERRRADAERIRTERTLRDLGWQTDCVANSYDGAAFHPSVTPIIARVVQDLRELAQMHRNALTQSASPPQPTARRIQEGDMVRLKAGGDPMTVTRISSACDGTSSDGSGLYCQWQVQGEGDEAAYQGAWLSESSVERVDPPHPSVVEDADWQMRATLDELDRMCWESSLMMRSLQKYLKKLILAKLGSVEQQG